MNTGTRIIFDCQWGPRPDYSPCHTFKSIQTFSSSIPDARVRIMDEWDRGMLTKESSKGDKFDGRLVVPVEKGKFYLVTNCISDNNMTRIDDKIAYVLPDNESVERISPYLKSIFDDGKIILQEVTECEALNKETLRASFYKNGVLINNKFSNFGLTPEIFAEAGMKFIGSEHDDRVVCALNENHGMRNWELNDRPVSEHIQHFETLPCRGPLPLMIDSEGNDVLGKVYKPLLLLTKDIGNEFWCKQCRHSFIISDKDTVLHNEGYSPFELVVDIAIKKTDVDSDEYTELLKQKLYMANYEKPLKELSEAEKNYKKTLEIHRTELLGCRELLSTKIHPSKSDTDQIDNIDEDLEEIETMNGIFENKIVECIVNGFISARASLSSMQKRKEIIPELNIDRENEAIKELQVTFTKLHFPDLALNDLVEAGKFATLARSSLEDDLHASTLNRETLLREGDYLLSIYANIASILRTDLNLI